MNLTRRVLFGLFAAPLAATGNVKARGDTVPVQIAPDDVRQRIRDLHDLDQALARAAMRTSYLADQTRELTEAKRLLALVQYERGPEPGETDINVTRMEPQT